MPKTQGAVDLMPIIILDGKAYRHVRAMDLNTRIDWWDGSPVDLLTDYALLLKDGRKMHGTAHCTTSMRPTGRYMFNLETVE